MTIISSARVLKSEVATEDGMIVREEVGGRSLRRLSPLVLLRMALTPHLQVHSIVVNLIRRCPQRISECFIEERDVMMIEVTIYNIYLP
jgi:hypothetical protein